ncbi:MAG: hypothetical protein OEY59_05975, partial [Deltaproteobacteria bacterium]|nr:hypothetical protein [Deltaproteobacteria bacterium]
MLNKLFQSKEDSNREKVDVLIKSGIKLLSEKFFNRAMIEFDKAMAVSREEAYPKLKKELENVANSGSYESALSIGLNMMKDNTTDFELANKLGNFARQLKNYPQAEGLYKQALKINKNYEKAFYNLAASMARINKYDEALISSVSIFDKVTDYILPDYIGPKDIIEKMTEKLMDEKEEATTQKLQVLTLEKDNKEADGESVAVSELEHEIKLLTEKPIEIKPVDVINGFRKEIEEDPEHALNHRFNLALYAIRNKQPDVAEQAIKDLSSDDYETLDLLKALILDVQGKKEDAANLLIKLLGKNEFNRYYNVNLGLLYKKAGKKFLSIKYLIKTAGLLEKSNGLYSMNDLLAVADENYTTGNLKKALNFYKIAATE